MKTAKRKKTFGFTVIELMIVVAIVAILTALAYPSFIQYLRKAKRGEAQELLLDWSIKQEIFRSNNPQYATTGEIPVPTHDSYAFDLPARSATEYTLRADASGDQAEDVTKDGTSCEVMTINQISQKTPPACWD